MKKCLILIILLSAYVLYAQLQVEDNIWIYDAANPPSLEQTNDMWQKPIWVFAAQDNTKGAKYE